MEMLVPWAAFCALIELHYLKVRNGRTPVGLERMLRMYMVANWFNLTDEACEDALYDIPAFRDFCRTDLGRERVPDSDKETDRKKSSVRSKVEHPFLTLKHLWGFTKVRYRGLAKNTNRAFAMLALINLTKWGIPLMGQVRPA